MLAQPRAPKSLQVMRLVRLVLERQAVGSVAHDEFRSFTVIRRNQRTQPRQITNANGVATPEPVSRLGHQHDGRDAGQRRMSGDAMIGQDRGLRIDGWWGIPDSRTTAALGKPLKTNK